MKRRKGWLMELAEREVRMIKKWGHGHFTVLAAQANFKEAWEKVRAIQINYGLPSHKKEED